MSIPGVNISPEVARRMARHMRERAAEFSSSGKYTLNYWRERQPVFPDCDNGRVPEATMSIVRQLHDARSLIAEADAWRAIADLLEATS